MSTATTAATSRDLPQEPRTPSRSRAFWIFVLATITLDLTLVIGSLWVSRGTLEQLGWGLLAWVGIVAVVGFASVQSETGPQLGLDMPLSLAAGFLFGPGIGGAIAFIGFVDPREFGGQISLVRALFNRAQTSLSVFVASLAFSLVGGHIGAWPSVGMAVLIAVPVDSLVNYALVTIAVSLHDRTSPRAAFAGMRVGPPKSFVLTYISYGLLSVLLAEIYLKVGAWGLVAFAMPVLLARQALAQGRELEITGDRLRRQTAVLHDVSSRVVDERRDERLAVAAGLHDEVLPPLVKVHLMGQVIRHDLATGQLLALEVDVPDLIRTVEHASEVMRLLIRDLRDSALGTGGLADTVRRMAQDLEAESSARIEVEVEDVGGTPFVQLLTYHVAREALRNAVRHSGAAWIHLYLAQDGQNLRLVVEDDGDGFVMAEVDVDRHFGVSLMRERVELAGGVLTIDSIPGSGTTVAARLPTGSF